ncbi:deoxynucleoside kinase [Deinococcus sonorensis]|uniref:Deoxynucleoside kinase n=2 Tax=Deinococcus sonorensis TaxID=309891 RepID=A0AAU7UE86_9DEIO
MYIAISGNIGSGKSTLTGMIAARYSLTPVYEAFEDNPYLQDFYQDMRRYSFHSQVFFLSKRLSQHLTLVNGAERVIQDRTIFEDAGVFARNLYESGQMEDRDWRTYDSLYGGILPALRTPDLLIHIDGSLPTLRRRIAMRGRAYEQTIPDEYLERLGRLYDAWAAGYQHSPLLRIPGDTLDFVADPEGFGWVCRQIEQRGLREPILR